MDYSKNFNKSNFKLELMTDKRFIISKYLKRIKKFNQLERIYFLLLNNQAHTMYLNNKIKYNEIINFIFKNMPKKQFTKFTMRSFNSIISQIDKIKKKYAII